jgi:hypothetical protein
MGKLADDHRACERFCREAAGRADTDLARTGLLASANHFRGMAEAEERRNWFADTVQTQPFRAIWAFPSNLLNSYGERGGTRTLDPMIKSHVLYRLSYALTCA